MKAICDLTSSDLSENFTVHLKPVLDKNNIFMKMKVDKRMKSKVYHMKLHVNEGYIEGDFVVNGITIQKLFDEERFIKL